MLDRTAITATALAGALLACKGAEPSPRVAPPRQAGTSYESVLIEGVPHVEQKPDFCGEAAVEMYARSLGADLDQDDVFALSGMDPARGMGATTREMKTALERLGFDVGPVWYAADADDADRDMARLFDDLYADLARGVPSIVCTHYDDQPNTTEHFRLVLGYDADTDEVIYHEPAEADGAYRRMSRALFVKLWPLEYDDDRWTVIRMRLAGRELAAAPPAQPHSKADFAQHVMALRERLPRGFHLVVEPPFVVIGNGTADEVRSRAEGTVRWAVERLERDYFDRPPARILDVWLFEDDASYRKYARELFGDDPDTPYGYYSSADGALVMNISTGGGTLVHEIVHPYIETNFPGCPAWFNEGLGSLYEQSSSRDGHIVGLTNWRLAGLQDAIRAGDVPTFAELLATTDGEFYGDDSGVHYAQARYLLYYLQERGLLIDFYRRFRADRARDPTGYRTLLDVLELDADEVPAFERRWQRYVLSLRFR